MLVFLKQRSTVKIAWMGIILLPVMSHAETYFNPAFLSNDPAAVADLSHFSKDGSAPGIYRVDIYLNNQFMMSRDVNFISAQSKHDSSEIKSKNNDAGELQACLTEPILNSLGVNFNILSDAKKLKQDTCISIADVIPSAQAKLNFEQLKLDISLPQASLNTNARGYIPEEQWDQGINALLLNYNYTGSNSWTDSSKTTNDFLSLQSGLNLGPWRLRDSSSYTHTSSDSGGGQSDLEHISTYVERTIIPLKGEFTGGDTSTASDVFASLPFRGARLTSDDNMLPDSLKGFAPTIRGIAKSNAKVTITQNGYTIYQTYVSPGAFSITDLYPTSSSGDLSVTVEETDGSTSSYTVPYSSVPLLQREGRVKYDISIGEYRSGGDQQDTPMFGQGTLIWGLPQGFTAYGGLQYASNYRSLAVGLGKNLGDWGAVSADVTQANSTLADDSDHEGQSVRFLYAKSLSNLGTDFQLLGYRYSTQGFYTLDETAYKMMSGYTGDDHEEHNDSKSSPIYDDYYNLYYTKRGKVQVSVSQQVGSLGSIFITGSQQSYWHTDEKDTLIQTGYNGSAWGISYGLNYNYNKTAGQSEADKMVAFNVSVPIGQWLSAGGSGTNTPNNTYLTYNNNTDNNGNVTQQAGVSGTLLKDNNLNYSVTEGYGNKGVGDSGSTSLDYQGGYGNANIGYNYSSGYKQVNYGLSGGVVLHRNGLTLSQPLGDTNILVAAPGADNVSIENNTGVKTDWRGYAIVPYANTYQQNRVALDTNTLNLHTDLDETVTNVVPTQGALVRANFDAHVGVRALLTLTHVGKALPFGASVSRIDTAGSGIVGDNGQVYLSGLPLKGALKAQWGTSADQQCHVSYELPAESLQKAIVYQHLVCQ